ncbi:uncharacterized protein LOC126264646 [Aethina tumida]|uniref:uncharacterized protein LOC126264646 n=1 Tax=Aethina tumida TaxID=116153 RepID=UPI0021490B80|nr:uncharacterized protein LOC126264646 [Aethina tumida]
MICILTGMFLHYTVLAQLCWMTLMSYFQYRRYVIIFNSEYTNIILKTILIGWVLPIFGIIKHKIKSFLRAILKLSNYLFFLFGLTWLFGIVYAFTDNLYVNYCFTALTSVQGFMICLHAIITAKQKVVKISTGGESLQSTRFEKFSGSSQTF